jgi:alkanesulfonate monooxygenase SsuD/methylene tetrahydromethanopterin reductase-like flavin-dependent oxidoreductase (luciferase family)
MLGLALRDTGLSLRDLTALARCADDLGYSSIWAPEAGSRDAIFLAGLYGTHTRRASVGTGVVPVYSRKIVSLALSVAAAAEASEGRFILGLGAGHRFATEAWYEARWHNPRERMRDTTEVLRSILAGERVSHNGELSVNGFHLGATPPPVPIYFAALTPLTLRLAGEIADGVILNWLPPDGAEKASLLVREAAADAGRSVGVSAYVRTAVVTDPALEHDANIALREQTYAYLSLPAYANSVRKVGLGRELDGMTSGHEKSLAALVDALCASGERDAVRAKLDEYREAGLDEVIVYPVPFGDAPTESVLETIRSAQAEP